MSADNRKRTDLYDTRAVGTVFHTEISNFLLPKQNPSITYETQNVLVSALEEIQKALEKHFYTQQSFLCPMRVSFRFFSFIFVSLRILCAVREGTLKAAHTALFKSKI